MAQKVIRTFKRTETMPPEVKPATETTPAPPIAPEEDVQAKIAKLESEKENYRKAYLLEVEKGKGRDNETDDDKLRRIAQEEFAKSKIVEISREQQLIIDAALKENKELKLAQRNKTNEPPAAAGTHTEIVPVRDTLVTPEQMASFKAKGWSDKDIERYKKNLQKNSR